MSPILTGIDFMNLEGIHELRYNNRTKLLQFVRNKTEI